MSSQFDSRDSSISPGTRSPRSASPITHTTQERPPPGPHPLRQSETNGNVKKAGSPRVDANSRPATASSVKVRSPDQNGDFPFYAPNGTAGESPTTTDLTYGNGHTTNSALNGVTAVEESQASDAGPSTTPPGRRSVQFARSATFESALPHSRQQSGDSADAAGNERERHYARLKSKLKSLATTPLSLPTHTRSGTYTGGDEPIEERLPSGEQSTPSERDVYPLDEDNEADAEESATEDPTPLRPARKRRKSRRHPDAGTQTAPTTPRMVSRLPSWMRDSPGNTPISPPNTHSLFRRATMSEIPEQRQGLSEDEGRNRLSQEPNWRRRSGWHLPRGRTYAGWRSESQESPDARRPSNFRRLTGIRPGHQSDASPSVWRQRTERTGSLSAQKWRQIKAGLKMLGQKRREQNKIDHAKSAELVAELLAATPAALFLASTFQRDEYGHKKIPVLLEQLKVSIVDGQRADSDRHAIFRIEMEYGSGMTRMKWSIVRSLRDFANLHVKYKLQGQTEKYIQLKTEDRSKAKMPRFPKSAFPYLRGVRGLMDDDEEAEEEAAQSGGEGNESERPGKSRRRRSSFQLNRRKSSIASPQTPGVMTDAMGPGTNLLRLPYHDRQRMKLEAYIQQMITWSMFRAEGNRLCKFLELSALGVRLAAEGGYHGKEGIMMVASQGLPVNFRTRFNPRNFVTTHTTKWFLVRHSYIVWVDDPGDMNPCDVLLVDSNFTLDAKKRLRDENAREVAKRAKNSAAHPQHHALQLSNSERKLKLLAKNERQLYQFEDSIRFMMRETEWSKPHRFDSFAPVRRNTYAQWLVDGRDYMWNVSRAMSMAKDVIYIHDWWLSPELYMRRPPAISSKWRLDRLLKRKAEEGVKIYVIMYRNVNSAIPIDSEYSKFSLLDLHPNVFVQRSPNQIRQNTFFWAHHEKLCVIDHTIAFCGGVDLCFGRWDTPDHKVVDDHLTGYEPHAKDIPQDTDHFQTWPGKDYSNPRVQDFYALDKPYEEMYDRSKVPRMPWHDIAMQIVGQPARDLTRHFVQRWNYILRQRKPSRPTPFLLPPPDFVPGELEALGLDGTCEVQILRSACEWSLGTPDRTEHSIMTAYTKMIETSEHFVYIENQFFITSCQLMGTRVENKIGDALFERIYRAHRNNEDWRCVVVIPLMPGFQNTVDNQDGTSVRLIMQCQYRSICRGESSLFERLHAEGIEPEDYLQFYSLRSWGKIGPTKALTTEQLYIHAKCMVVDDRVAIIGSANINERSMLGSRDSELAAVVRDTRMVQSVMAGKPYNVGHFPHTLRMRLMREHLGLDVDEIYDDEQFDSEDELGSFHSGENSDIPDSPVMTKHAEDRVVQSHVRSQDEMLQREKRFSQGVDGAFNQEHLAHLLNDQSSTQSEGVASDSLHPPRLSFAGPSSVKSDGDGRDGLVSRGTIYSDGSSEPPREVKSTLSAPHGRRRAKSNAKDSVRSVGSNLAVLPPRPPRMNTAQLGLTQLSQLPALPVTDDTDIGGPPLMRSFGDNVASSDLLHSLVSGIRQPLVSKDCMRDPVHDAFHLDTWNAIAENNTKIFRSVFRCMPDSEVKNWREYRAYDEFAAKFNQAQGNQAQGAATNKENLDRTYSSGPPGADLHTRIKEKATEAGLLPETTNGSETLSEKNGIAERMSSTTTLEDAEKRAELESTKDFALPPMPPIPNDGNSPTPRVVRGRTVTYSEPVVRNQSQKQATTTTRRRRATTKSSSRPVTLDEMPMLSKEDAETALGMVQGHLIAWPYDWLVNEEKGGGWLYAVDRMAPLEIYS